MVLEGQDKKGRRDKGTVRATKRDEYCIKWIAEQYAARLDQIQRLLSRFPDSKHPFRNGTMIAETTTRVHIARWVRAGWIENERILAEGPAWAWVSRAGLDAVDLAYTARPPSVVRLNHIYAVNKIRLSLDKKYAWVSERELRSQLDAAQKGKSSGPIPDGVILHPSLGRTAIEVQLTGIKPYEMQRKLLHLLRENNVMEPGLKLLYPSVWVYVASEPLKKLVDKACQALQDEERRRVSTILVDMTM